MKYIAFLRAINVGGHTVKMPVLKQLFDEMGFHDVDTFIASGNVIFDARQQASASLEKKIERVLYKGLGYEVATFIRTIPELAEAARSPFDGETGTVYVGFLHEAPSVAIRKKVEAIETDVDRFAVKGKELYWLVTAASFSETQYSGAKLEKLMGVQTTMRNMNTVERLLLKHS